MVHLCVSHSVVSRRRMQITISNQGLRWHLLKAITPKRRPCASPYREMNFFPSVQEPGAADQANKMPFFCLHGPTTFCNSWISLKTYKPIPQTDSWSLLPALNVVRQAPKLESSALVPCDIWWRVQLSTTLVFFPRIPYIYWMQQSTILSKQIKKTRARPLQL